MHLKIAAVIPIINIQIQNPVDIGIVLCSIPPTIPNTKKKLNVITIPPISSIFISFLLIYNINASFHALAQEAMTTIFPYLLIIFAAMDDFKRAIG